ncbi:hypothetical protein PMAYCL1PPCAC_04597, partial [Pristionchus mayeri]
MNSDCQCSTFLFNFRTLSVTSTVFATIGPIGFSTCRLTLSEIQWRLEESPLMRWLENKPEYLIYSIPMRPHLQIFLAIFLICMLLFSLACGSLMAHTIHIVRRSKLKSGKSKDLTNAAMRNLFIQFSVFALSLLFPAFIFLFRIWVEFD